MKRLTCAVLAAILFAAVFPINASAAGPDQNEKIVAYLEDGGYITETIEYFGTRASGTRTGTKTRSGYTGDGTMAWQVALTGTFTYTGSGATCTSSICNTTVYESAWYTISKDAGKSGASATGSATMGRKSLEVTVEKVPVSITLTCDANGNLS